MADSTTKTVGVDLAKQVFAICETNHSGHVILNRPGNPGDSLV